MDNIYPDKSNDKFDIQYARLLGLSSDLRASFGVVEEEIGSSPAPSGFPIETPSDVDTGPDTGSAVRFGVAGEDDTATENRSFNLAGAYSFAITQQGNNQFLVDPANGLYQLGAVPVPGSDSGLSYTYLEIDDTTQKIKLQAPDGIVLPGYGYGNHSGTYTKFLAVDAGGNMIEVDAPGGGSVTADNGLTMSTATNVKLGGTLLQNTTIATGAFGLTVSTSTAASIPLTATATTGTAGYFVATSGFGVRAEASGSNPAGKFGLGNATTSSPITPLQILAFSTGTAANGFGPALDFYSEASDNSNPNALRISAINKDATAATYSTELQISVQSNNALTQRAVLTHEGILGLGIYSGLTATRLNVVDNTVGAASIVDITSTSTAAASNIQKGINVSLSGTNSASGQTTWGIFSSNTHAGGSSSNVGVYGIATGGTNVNFGVYGTTTSTLGGSSAGVIGSNGSTGYGVLAQSNGNGIALNAEGPSTGYGVYATASTSGVGVRGNSSTGYGVQGFSTSGSALAGLTTNASNSSVATMIELLRQTTGNGANGIGASIDYKLATTTTNDILANQIISKWTVATHASRESSMILNGVFNAATVDLLTLAGNGSVKLRPITATEASAITPAEGMLVFVSNTNGTFAAIGIHCYENGAWVKL